MQGTHTTNPSLFLTSLVFAFCLALCGSSAAQPVSKQPAWVFPIYFEEGGGQRDSVYLCYDSSATLNEDPEFGDTLVPIDTTKFNAFFYAWQDTLALKKDVGPLVNNSIQRGDINFINGILPLKIKWNKQLLYSDSLPFPDQSPAPRAQGEFFWGGPGMATSPGGCGYGMALIVTDTVTYNYDCVRSDSVTFVEFWGGNTTPLPLDFFIKPWTGHWVGISESFSTEQRMIIFPNPGVDNIFIKTEEMEASIYKLYDVSGRICKTMVATGGNAEINISDMANGVYSLIIMTGNHTRFAGKVLVIR